MPRGKAQPSPLWAVCRNVPAVCLLFSGGLLVGFLAPVDLTSYSSLAVTGGNAQAGPAVPSVAGISEKRAAAASLAEQVVGADTTAAVTLPGASRVDSSAPAVPRAVAAPPQTQVPAPAAKDGAANFAALVQDGGKPLTDCDDKDHQQAQFESYGFFDEANQSWSMRKRIHNLQTSLEQQNLDVQRTCSNKDSQYFWDVHYNPSFSCSHVKRIGRNGDGGKWVCDPHKLAASAATGKGCLVYSIGSNGDYSFEKSVHDEISPHCEIFTVDRSHWSTYTKVAPPKYMNYHIYTVGNPQHDPSFTNVAGIVKALGHHGRVIDIFKIDCEGCEWRTYLSWLGEGVFIRQIQVEVHGLHEGVPAAHAFFKYLFDNGYVIFHKEPNMACYKCVEYSFVKMRPEFWNLGTIPQTAKCNPSNTGDRSSIAESYGFYDENEESWALRKKIAAWQRDMQQKHGQTIEYSDNTKFANHFWDDNYQPSFSCTYERRIGVFQRGGKWFCDPHKIAAKTAAGGHCIAYSIGDDGDYRFERSVHDEISSSCEIHKFGAKDWRQYGQETPPDYVHYNTYRIGDPEKDAANVTLASIVKALGHENKVIDVLKVDCNGCEWHSYRSWLGDGVFIRQIQVHVHLLYKVSIINDMFKFFQDNGYVIFHKEGDLPAEGRSQEFALVKMAPGFFKV